MLDKESMTALHAKIELKKIPADLGDVPLEAEGLFAPEFDDFPAGTFHGLENIRLRWAAPDYFEFVPRAAGPFEFVRSNGEVIQPRRMFTDGGSIPRSLWWKKSLSPWGYAPAFLVHDWEFDTHHCGRTQKSFDEVRDTMMEGMKTLMLSNVCPRSDFAFKAIYTGINSFVAKRLWDKTYPDCPLPPDRVE